jgi:YHS domain-containing protein
MIFWLLRMVFKNIGDGMRTAATQPPQGAAVGHQLIKDPVCGTFVSPDAAVTLEVKGQVLHFCSAECRDKYRG